MRRADDRAQGQDLWFIRVTEFRSKLDRSVWPTEVRANRQGRLFVTPAFASHLRDWMRGEKCPDDSVITAEQRVSEFTRRARDITFNSGGGARHSPADPGEKEAFHGHTIETDLTWQERRN